MNTISPTFVIAQVGRNLLTLDGDGEQSGPDYLMMDETRPNWIDGLDGHLNKSNRLHGVPCKNRAVRNQKWASIVHVLQVFFGFSVCVGASRNWIFHYPIFAAISVRRGGVCNI